MFGRLLTLALTCACLATPAGAFRITCEELKQHVAEHGLPKVKEYAKQNGVTAEEYHAARMCLRGRRDKKPRSARRD